MFYLFFDDLLMFYFYRFVVENSKVSVSFSSWFIYLADLDPNDNETK